MEAGGFSRFNPFKKKKKNLTYLNTHKDATLSPPLWLLGAIFYGLNWTQII